MQGNGYERLGYSPGAMQEYAEALVMRCCYCGNPWEPEEHEGHAPVCPAYTAERFTEFMEQRRGLVGPIYQRQEAVR